MKQIQNIEEIYNLYHETTSYMKILLTKILFAMFTGLAAFFIPITGSIIFVVTLVITDTVTGIMKAGYKNVEEIQSKKMFRLVPKVTFYLLFLIVSHGVSLIWKLPLVNLCLAGIIWIEGKSIDENFKAITGFSFIEKILEAIRNFKKFERK